MTCKDEGAALRTLMRDFSNELRGLNGEPEPRYQLEDSSAELRIYLHELRTWLDGLALERRIRRIEDHLGLSTG